MRSLTSPHAAMSGSCMHDPRRPCHMWHGPLEIAQPVTVNVPIMLTASQPLTSQSVCSACQ